MVIIKRLDRYIFGRLLGPFIAGLAGTCIITSFGPLLRAIKLLTRGTIKPEAIAEWFIYRITEDMQFIFPVAVLLTTLITFGGMSKDSEITAMRAAGISLGRLLYPVAFFGVLVTIGVFLFLDKVVPPAMYRSQRIWEREIRKETEAKFKKNILLRSKNGGLFYVGKFDLRTQEVTRLLVKEYTSSPENVSGDDARSQKLKVGLSAMKARCVLTDDNGSVWELHGVHFRDYRIDNAIGTGSLLKIENHRLPEGIADLQKTTMKDPREFSFSELLDEIRYLEERGLANTSPLKVELYLKTSFPFCVIIFALIGSTMGLSSHRSGGFVGFGISLVITFLYYICMSLSSSFGKTGSIDPFISAWLHNIIFFAFAIYNVFRVQYR